MVEIPLDFHYSRMMVEAQQRGCVKDAATLAIACSQTDIDERLDDEALRKAQANAKHEFEVPPGSDFLARLRMFKAFEEVGKNKVPEEQIVMRKAWAKARYLRYATFERIEEERDELLDRLDYQSTGNETTDEAALSRCIFEGFRDNLLTRSNSHFSREKNKTLYSYSLQGEPHVQNSVIHSGSTVVPGNAQYAVSAGNYVRQQETIKNGVNMGRRYIFMKMNQTVDPSWLPLAA